MRYLIIFLFLLINSTFAFANGHLTKDQKAKTIECAGIYYANSMIPQAELELDKIVHSFAAKKFLSSYLVKEGVNEDNLNKELIKVTDFLGRKSGVIKKTPLFYIYRDGTVEKIFKIF